jgi:magnesium transporter
MPKSQEISKNIQQVIIDNPITPEKKLTWTNIANAGKDEIEYLRKRYNFNLTHLQASSAKVVAQRPRVEQGEGYLFIILHFPVFVDSKIIPGEIEFFVGPDYLITLHNNNVRALNQFFNLCKKEGNSLLAYELESAYVLLYELLEKLVKSCYALLDKNSIAINKVGKLISAQEQKKAVSQIMSLRLNIINIRKIMQNHKNIMKKLMRWETKHIPAEKMKNYYIGLIEHSKRIWENLENQKETVEILNSTNESLLNYRISDIMKTLTIFSVIVFPLSLLAAIFGMNTTMGMPFMDTENGFWVIITFMLTGCLGMLLFFEKKKWL